MSAMQHRNDEPSDDLRARVGDLALRVENGFNRVDADLRDLRQEVGQNLLALRQEMNRETRGLRMLIYGSASSLFLTVIAAQLLG